MEAPCPICKQAHDFLSRLNNWRRIICPTHPLPFHVFYLAYDAWSVPLRLRGRSFLPATLWQILMFFWNHWSGRVSIRKHVPCKNNTKTKHHKKNCHWQQTTICLDEQELEKVKWWKREESINRTENWNHRFKGGGMLSNIWLTGCQLKSIAIILQRMAALTWISSNANKKNTFLTVKLQICLWNEWIQTDVLRSPGIKCEKVKLLASWC